MKGIKAFMEATNLQSGSIIGYYNIYEAILEEWRKAKKIRKSH